MICIWYDRRSFDCMYLQDSMLNCYDKVNSSKEQLKATAGENELLQHAGANDQSPQEIECFQLRKSILFRTAVFLGSAHVSTLFHGSLHPPCLSRAAIPLLDVLWQRSATISGSASGGLVLQSVAV